jgi:sulfur carrier protein ThiS
MNCILNVQPHQIDGKSTIPELIEGLEIARREYAMEKKGEFVPRSSRDHYRLAAPRILEGEFLNGKTKNSTARF